MFKGQLAFFFRSAFELLDNRLNIAPGEVFNNFTTALANLVKGYGGSRTVIPSAIAEIISSFTLIFTYGGHRDIYHTPSLFNESRVNVILDTAFFGLLNEAALAFLAVTVLCTWVVAAFLFARATGINSVLIAIDEFYNWLVITSTEDRDADETNCTCTTFGKFSDDNSVVVRITGREGVAEDDDTMEESAEAASEDEETDEEDEEEDEEEVADMVNVEVNAAEVKEMEDGHKGEQKGVQTWYDMVENGKELDSGVLSTNSTDHDVASLDAQPSLTFQSTLVDSASDESELVFTIGIPSLAAVKSDKEHGVMIAEEAIPSGVDSKGETGASHSCRKASTVHDRSSDFFDSTTVLDDVEDIAPAGFTPSVPSSIPRTRPEAISKRWGPAPPPFSPYKPLPPSHSPPPDSEHAPLGMTSVNGHAAQAMAHPPLVPVPRAVPTKRKAFPAYWAPAVPVPVVIEAPKKGGRRKAKGTSNGVAIVESTKLSRRMRHIKLMGITQAVQRKVKGPSKEDSA